MKIDEQLKCKDCDWFGSCEYYDRRKETSQICKMFNNTWKFVAELEKIKAEIEEANVHLNQMPSNDYYSGIRQGHWGDLQIIEKHIAELKRDKNV